jgi:predicted Zn-dependent protease
VAALLAALAAQACDSPTMTVADRGYPPTGLVPFTYHWAPGQEIRIFVDETAEPEGVDLEAAVRDGIAAWEATALLGEVRMRIVGNPGEADVIVHHAGAPPLVSFDPEICSPNDLGAGRTFFCVTEELVAQNLPLNDGSGGRVMMDVRFNSAVLEDLGFFPGVVAHELGHVLGIGAHSSSTDDLMFGTPRRSGPSAADAATLRHVLSTPAAVRF